jgi:hypothetical protein
MMCVSTTKRGRQAASTSGVRALSVEAWRTCIGMAADCS